jgi:hypothetical protein
MEPDRRAARDGAAALTCLCAVLAAAPWFLRLTADPDLWWHLKTGLLILDLGKVPRADSFSFTYAGAPWFNHEWLAEVALALAYQAAGGAGITLLRIALFSAAVAGLGLLLWRRLRQPLLVIAILLAAVPTLNGFLSFRPHIWTYLLTIVYLLCLDGAAGGRPNLLLLMPPLMAAWVNLHGGFLTGLAVAAVGIASLWVGGEHGRKLRGPGPWIVLALTFLAPLANPYGWRLVSYLAQELGARHSFVLEWRGVMQSPGALPLYAAWTVAPLVGLALALRHTRLTEATLFLAAVAATYRHVRFLPLLVIFGSLVLATAAAPLWERITSERVRQLLGSARAAAVPAAVLALLAAPALARDARRKGLQVEVDVRQVPVLGTRALAQLGLSGNLATRVDWGGHAIWHLWPTWRVSVDGRNLTVYPESFVELQLAAYDHGEPLAGLAGHGVDAVLVESAGPGFEGMTRDPAWTLIYSDPLSALFLPRATAQQLEPTLRALPALSLDGGPVLFP